MTTALFFAVSHLYLSTSTGFSQGKGQPVGGVLFPATAYSVQGLDFFVNGLP